MGHPPASGSGSEPPEVVDAIRETVSDRGRVFVEEAKGYPRGAPTTRGWGETRYLSSVIDQEHLAGFWIIEAPDLDVAFELAAEPQSTASSAGGLCRVPCGPRRPTAPTGPQPPIACGVRRGHRAGRQQRAGAYLTRCAANWG